MLPIKKMYIDSRHRTPDSISTSRFKIQLDRAYTFGKNSVFFITDICIPHSWRTVEQGMNNKLYWAIYQPNPPGGFQPRWVYHCTTVASGTYTPATLITAS
jgi:hypothetical protein